MVVGKWKGLILLNPGLRDTLANSIQSTPYLVRFCGLVSFVELC